MVRVERSEFATSLSIIATSHLKFYQPMRGNLQYALESNNSLQRLIFKIIKNYHLFDLYFPPFAFFPPPPREIDHFIFHLFTKVVLRAINVFL